jgi:retron-type reverse transcriptase
MQSRKRFVKNKEGQRDIAPKLRHITYPSHVDALIYAYYSELISERYEKILAPKKRIGRAVLAFRSFNPPKSHILHAKETFNEIRKRKECAVLAFDVKSFFDSIDHKTLKAALKSVLGVHELPEDHYRVFKHLTQYSYVELSALETVLEPVFPDNKKPQVVCTRKELEALADAGKIVVEHNKEKKGIPQGASISTVLSNVYMLDFDAKMSEAVGKSGVYRRYCDDLFFIVPKKKAQTVRQTVLEELTKIKLEANPSKTELHFCKKSDDGSHSITKIGENGSPIPGAGIQYLGFLFDGKSVRLRDSTLARFQRKMKRTIEKAVYLLRKRKIKALAEEKGDAIYDAIYRKGLNSAVISIPNTEFKRFRRGLLRRFAIPHPTKNNLGNPYKKNFNFADYVKKTAKIMDAEQEKKIEKQFGRAVKIFDRKLIRELKRNGILVDSEPRP